MKYLTEWSIFDDVPDVSPGAIKHINKDTNGSFAKVGTIYAAYEQLVEKLGEPIFLDEEETYGKIQVSWYITFEDGSNAHIYDYKAGVSYDVVDRWSIGGNLGQHSNAVDYIKDIFPNNDVYSINEEMDIFLNRRL